MNVSSITQTPMREAAMERLLKDVLGYPKDESIMRDQHDPTTQPSLHGQVVDRRTRCGACGRLQPLPAMWPTCRRCETEICPACRVTGSVDANQWRCDCHACAALQATGPAILETPDPDLAAAETFNRDQSVLAQQLRETWWVSPEDKRRLYQMFRDETYRDEGTLVRIARWAEARRGSSAMRGQPDVAERLAWLATWCDGQIGDRSEVGNGE